MATLWTAGLHAAAGGGDAPKDKPDKTPSECVHWHHEARYSGFGYDHVVHIDNTCTTPAECDVQTNVNPKRIQVRVPAKSKAEVITFRGSPARVFRPQVQCRLKP